MIKDILGDARRTNKRKWIAAIKMIIGMGSVSVACSCLSRKDTVFLLHLRRAVIVNLLFMAFYILRKWLPISVLILKKSNSCVAARSWVSIWTTFLLITFVRFSVCLGVLLSSPKLPCNISSPTGTEHKKLIIFMKFVF